jgi:hypothetical protein
MQQPQYANAEFVTETIFNTAASQTMKSIREMGSNSVFFQPGVVQPSALAFTFNGNLTVTLNAPPPFKCLFGTGAYAGAHGITDGTDSSTYPNISFSGLVPGSGSVTAYIVGQYASVQLDPVVIIGPPPGHPDYSPSFLPYTAYTRIQDTINIIATTVAPDNLTSIELARTTLTAGQTQITTVNTSHQVLATVIVNLNGDVLGPSYNTTISKIQGVVVTASGPFAPVDKQVLTCVGGTEWTPITPFLNGDVQGAAHSNTINKIQNNPVIAPTPTTGQVLQWNGSAWVPAPTPSTLPPSGPAGGDLSGTYPNPRVTGIETVPITNSPTVSGQVPVFSSIGPAIQWATPIGGSIGAGYITIPVGTQTLILNFGTFTSGAPFQEADTIVIPWNLAYPTACLGALTTMVNHTGVPVNPLTAGALGLAALTLTNGTFKILAPNTGGNAPGVSWMSWGY